LRLEFYTLSLQEELYSLILGTTYYFAFFGLGLGFALSTKKWLRTNRAEFFIVCHLLAFFVCYILFFLFLFGYGLGLFALWGFLFFSAFQIYRHWPLEREMQKHLGFHIVLLLLLSYFYLSIVKLSGLDINHRFLWAMPVDNDLPRQLADCVVSYNLDSKRCFQGQGFWQSSDRPPLFASAIAFAIGLDRDNFHYYKVYQNYGTILQTTWINALVYFGLSIGMKLHSLRFLLISAIFSGVYLFNSVFLWPKLITALPCSFAFVKVVLEKQGRFRKNLQVFGFLSLGLAYLFHGAILFTLIPIFLLYFWKNRTIANWKLHLPKIVFIFLLILPWSLYQKWYDPPGDHLLKMRFAGQRNLDDPILYRNHPRLVEGESFLEAIKKSYTVVPKEDLINNRISNFLTFFYWDHPFGKEAVFSIIELGRWIKSHQFFYTLLAFDSLIFGFLLWSWNWMTNSAEGRASGSKIILVLWISVLLWILLMFEPGATVIHQGSYMNLIFLSLLVTRGFEKLGRVRWFLFALHFLVFLGWIPDYEGNTGGIQFDFLALATVLALGIFSFVMRIKIPAY